MPDLTLTGIPAGYLATTWSLIVAVNDPTVLEGTLLKSPDIDDRCQLITRKDYPCASKAYNDGIDEATNELLVFAHSDVFFPHGWLDRLTRAIRDIASVDPNWGVIGVIGISTERRLAGYVYSTGLRNTVGGDFAGAVEAVSLDEMVLIIRKSSGLRFDESLPGFHLYGTDICLQARASHMKSYIISDFCIHNSVGIKYLPWAFWRAYLYLRSRWRSHLPLKTCCTEITRGCWPIVTSLRTALQKALFSKSVGVRCSDPAMLYRELRHQRLRLPG